MAYLLLAVSVATYTFVVYLHPYLNLWYEVYKTEKTFELEQKELRLNSQKYDLMRKYPEMYTDQCNTVVEGFRHEAPEDEYYDNADYDEDEFDDFEEVENDDSMYKIEVKTDKKIGYKYDGKIR